MSRGARREPQARGNRARLIAAIAATIGAATVGICLLYSRDILLHWHLRALTRDGSRFLEYAESESELLRAVAERFTATEKGKRRVFTDYFEGARVYIDYVWEEVGERTPVRGFVIVYSPWVSASMFGPGVGRDHLLGDLNAFLTLDRRRRYQALEPHLPALHGRTWSVPDFPDHELRFIAGDRAARWVGYYPDFSVEGVASDGYFTADSLTDTDMKVLAGLSALVFYRRGTEPPDGA